ncbi:MAG: YegJ family protein [Chthoniobacterales bacterium]
MKKITTTLLAVLALGGICAAEDTTTHLSGRENKAPGVPGYQKIEDNDKQCERAAEKAQRALGFFMAALRAKKPGDSSFEIKKGFMDGENYEHLWITDVTYDGKNFHGTIDNKPVDVKNVHLGQRVTVKPGDVSDWMFVKNGDLMGGYTTRVLYARLSKEQKAEFDREAEFKIK